MSGLVLKLGPRERILINGAVIENGDRRSRLSIVTPKANILRLRDALHPDDASTPVRRICYTAQLILTGTHPPRRHANTCCAESKKSVTFSQIVTVASYWLRLPKASFRASIIRL